MELTFEIVAFLMAVAFVGGTIDAIAGGGGLITVPALMAAGASPAAALGTNKLQSTFGAAMAVLTFARKGRIDFRRFAVPTAIAFAASAAGAFLLTRIDPEFLSALIPALLIVMAIYYALKPDLGDEDRHVRARPILLLAVAAAIGFYDGFFGPGTGSFLTTALIALFGFGAVNAIAHAKLLNLSSNAASLLVLLAAGEVLLVPGLLMAVAATAGGYVGAHSTLRFGARAVRPLLILMCLALTARLLADPANPLTSRLIAWFS